MGTHQSVANESSVLFNLRQLMELEDARVQSEAEAARAAELAVREREMAARARAEQEAQQAESARVEALRQAQREAAGLEQEREAALLRARLEVEARGRAELELVALERERVALDHARVSRRLSGRTRGVVLASMVLVAATVGVVVVARPMAKAPPPAASVHEGPVVSASLFADQARELEALRERIASLSALALTVTPAASASPPSAASIGKRHPPKPGRVEGPRASALKQPELDIDTDSFDPIEGLVR